MSLPGQSPPAPGLSLAPIAIIAGSGGLAVTVAQSARAAGRQVFVAVLSGSGEASSFSDFDHAEFGLGQLGGLLKSLKSRHISEAAFIGGVIRPGLMDIKPDYGLVKHWYTITQAFKKGDDGLLTAVVDLLEAQGCKVVSALDLAPDLTAQGAGQLGSIAPSSHARTEIEQGLRVIEALSPFDVGQCVVVSDGRPVAIEGAEGTDGLLWRVAELRRLGRLKRETGGGVLVKAPKRGQNMRIDIPTIGPGTVQHAADAGLQGIAITAGKVLMADRHDMIMLADRLGLFVEAVE